MERESAFMFAAAAFFELALLTVSVRLLCIYREIGCNFLRYKFFQRRR